MPQTVNQSVSWRRLASVGMQTANRQHAHSHTHKHGHTHARTDKHGHKMHNCDKYYLLSPRHLSPTYFQYIAVTITARVNRLLPDVYLILCGACRSPCMCFFVRKCWLAPHACLNPQSAVICFLSACCSTSREDCDFHHCCHRHCGQENCHRRR